MTESKTPTRWANDINLLLNAFHGADRSADRFPVDVAALAKKFSAQVAPDDPISWVEGANLPGFDGALYPDPDGRKGWAIIYNDAMTSAGRINFTLAHEFGHYLLHRYRRPKGIKCGEQDIVRWDSEYGRIEHEANVFASNLLMPLDDFRRRIGPTERVTIDEISQCADRYHVSLIAATLKWLEYTEKRAVLVVSCDGYVLWSRASDPALKTRAFFRTSGSPIEVPANSLAGRETRMVDGREGIDLPPGVWFPEEVREMTIFSEQYEFAISLLLLHDREGNIQVDAEPEEDVFDRFASLESSR